MKIFTLTPTQIKTPKKTKTTETVTPPAYGKGGKTEKVSTSKTWSSQNKKTGKGGKKTCL